LFQKKKMENATIHLQKIRSKTESITRQTNEILEDYSNIHPTKLIIDNILPKINTLIFASEECYCYYEKMELNTERDATYQIKRALQKFKASLLKNIKTPRFMSHTSENNVAINSNITPKYYSKQNILNSWFIFDPNLPLKTYMKSKYKYVPDQFTLSNLMENLRKIIQREHMYDPSNPFYIICSKQLKHVFNKEIIHVNEICQLVCNQILRLCGPTNPIMPAFNSNFQKKTSIYKYPETTLKPNHYNKQCICKKSNALFKLKHNLKLLLLFVPGFNVNQIYYSYKEIRNLLTQYILSRQKLLSNITRKTRNTMYNLTNVINDPLCQIFNISEIPALLNSQLIYVGNKKYERK